MVEGLVAPHAPRKSPRAHHAERHRRDRRRKDRSRGAGHSIHDGDRTERRQPRQRERPDRDDEGGRDEQLEARMAAVDEGPGGRLREDPGDAADRHHHADGGFVPVVLREQIDREIGSEPVAHVGEEEVERIELSAEMLCRLRRGRTHNGPLKTKNAPAAIRPKPTAWLRVKLSLR